MIRDNPRDDLFGTVAVVGAIGIAAWAIVRHLNNAASTSPYESSGVVIHQGNSVLPGNYYQDIGSGQTYGGGAGPANVQ